MNFEHFLGQTVYVCRSATSTIILVARTNRKIEAYQLVILQSIFSKFYEYGVLVTTHRAQIHFRQADSPN